MSTSRRCLFYFIQFLVFAMSKVICQRCAESGHWCIDDKACCGGCCRNNACIDMYESCLIYEDMCLNHYCPPGLVCYIYQPDCMGCSPIPDCKEAFNKNRS